MPDQIQARSYELTYLIPPVYTDSELSHIHQSVEKLVQKHHGSVGEKADWGKLNMAYTIHHQGKRYDQAVYMHVIVSMPAPDAQQFEKELYLQPEVMRHLFVVAEEKAAAKE